MKTSSELLQHLIAKIREHRASTRPARRRKQDRDLYRALSEPVMVAESQPAKVIAQPPEEFRRLFSEYFDSPY